MNQSPSPVCPKCGDSMRQGFILDRANERQREVSQWAPGAPEKSFWLTTKLPDETLMPLGAFRCVACGYVELYAGPEFSAQ